MKNKINFLDWNNKILISSIKKIDWSIILIIVLDSLFYILSGYSILFWFQRINAKMSAFNLPNNIASLGYEQAQQLLGQEKSFYYLIIFSFIILLIAIIFLVSILKGIIWARTTKTKLTFNLISKFLALNLVWMGLWFIIFFLISYLVQPEAVGTFMIAALVISLYFTNTLYTMFMKNQNIKSIRDALKLNIMKIHLFLLPYIIIFLLLFIILKLSSILVFNYSDFVFAIMVVVYAAFVRYYVSTLASEAEKL